MPDKIYIAGKITGDESYRTKFQRAAERLEGSGNIVLNPSLLPDGMTAGDYMRICFAMIDSADYVALISDWKQSAGTRLERDYCKYIHKPLIYL